MHEEGEKPATAATEGLMWMVGSEQCTGTR